MAEKVKTAKAPAAPRKTTAKKKVVEPQPVNHHEIQSHPVQHDDVQQLAHRLWAERGHPNGDADTDWFRAEQELRGKAS